MHAFMLAAALCFGSPDAPDQPGPTGPAAPPQGAAVLESGGWVLRVAGEPEGELVERTGPEGPLYTAGRAITDTKLPVGYPAPTPPGAIELKHYPSIRRAEFSGAGRSANNAERGFWPLFRHITKNDIAMTAPVEMETTDADLDQQPDKWTMAFLYHRTEDGPIGNDAGVTVVDTKPKTFLSVGVRGRGAARDTDALTQTLDAWLATQTDWRRTGAPRTLGYNGPNIPWPDQWWEVQVPVEPVPDDTRATPPVAPNAPDAPDATGG